MAILEEVKVRLDAIARVAEAPLSDANPLAQEFCYLQLRMLCELIGLGCLVAHGDVTEQKRHFHSLYAAGQIISMIGELKPHFYPQPCSIVRTPLPGGRRNHHAEPITDGYLTRDELRTLDQKCGAFLHRGNLRKLLKSHALPRPDFAEVRQWHAKIERLLGRHFIFVVQSQSVILATLRDGDGGQATAGYAEAEQL